MSKVNVCVCVVVCAPEDKSIFKGQVQGHFQGQGHGESQGQMKVLS